jgi:hypothetical protein
MISKDYIIYVVFFVARIVILVAIWRKYGWKAWGLALMYALLTVISDVPEVNV